VTLTVVLVCGAALFLRSLRNLTQLDAGFQREGVLTMHVAATLPKTAAKDKAAEEEHARIGRMWNALLEPLHALPQVRTASVSTLSPMSGRRRGVLLDVSGAPPVAERDRGISINQVSAGYFETLGVKLSAGRLFTEADQANSPKVAILNETAARARFRDASPLGRRVTLPGQRITAEYEVVGIVKDTRYADLRKPAEPMVYLPLEQAIDPLSGVTVAIRARGDATGLPALVRRRAQETVPGGFLTDIATVQQQMDETLVEERMVSTLASLFGALALLLAAIGLYGVVSFSVIRRTREIGIRISIGAQQSSVLWLILVAR
jgi:MacB-like periplasmic core domain